VRHFLFLLCRGKWIPPGINNLFHLIYINIGFCQYFYSPKLTCVCHILCFRVVGFTQLYFHELVCFFTLCCWKTKDFTSGGSIVVSSYFLPITDSFSIFYLIFTSILLTDLSHIACFRLDTQQQYFGELFWKISDSIKIKCVSLCLVFIN